MMNVSEAMPAELDTKSWWVEFIATRDIYKKKEVFINLEEKKIGKHKVYMDKNSYCDVLRQGQVSIELIVLLFH